MKDRKELLQDLYEVKNIVGQAEEITYRYNKVKQKLVQPQKFIKMEDQLGTKVKNITGFIITSIVFGFIGFILFITAALFGVTKELIDVAIVYLVIVLCVLIKYLRREKYYAEVNRNRLMTINSENERIAEYNALVLEEAEKINAEMVRIRKLADQRFPSRYPKKYRYMEAVDFFIDAVENFRADSIEKAINLYEKELWHQKLLGKYDEMIRGIQINNILTEINTFAALQTMANTSEIASNTRDIASNTRDIYNRM